MPDILVQIAVPAPQPVAVQATGVATGVTVATAQTPLTVGVTAAQTPLTVAIAAAQTPQPVSVSVTEAPPGANGAAGTSVTPVVLTLAAYLALTAEQQLDATKWYVIPKTS